MSEVELRPGLTAEQFNAMVVDYCAELRTRTDCGVLLPADAEHVGLASLCLQDLADQVNVAGKAVYLAAREVERAGSDVDPAVVAHHFRYHFDYAAIALSAASNHLASAMWHFHERVAVPLGRGYKTATQVVGEWKSRTSPPMSLGLLRDLLAGQEWQTVSGYRDAWVHRGLPVLSGEYRRSRRPIWQAATDPAPSESTLTAVAPDGRVAYLVSRDTPQYGLPELLQAGVTAQLALMTVTRRFVEQLDQVCAADGVRFEDGKMMLRR